MSSTFTSYIFPFLGGIGLGCFRAAVGTPLDSLATREITENLSSRQAFRQLMEERAFYTGVSANAVKLAFKTPIQIITTGLASRIYIGAVPEEIRKDRHALRGAFIGITATCIDTVFWANPLNAVRTQQMTTPKLKSKARFIEQESSLFFKIIREQNFQLLARGLDASLLHRGMSGVIFFTTYEALKARYPDNHFFVSTASGIAQVCTTSPLYAAMIHQQKAKASKIKTTAIATNVFFSIHGIYQAQGLRGLFLLGLMPRLVHSIAVSHLVMYMLEEAKAILRN